MTFIVRADEQLLKDFDLACINRSVELGIRITRSEAMRVAMNDFIKKYKKVTKVK